ncbi:MAG TPA: S8 family serine peptidase [Symbiobacteriaceae bacterium]|nr:S8 family serine peptidase [Symbiobacteriaceae bacterium]
MSRVQLLPHVCEEKLVSVPAELRGGISQGIRLMGAPVMWAADWDGRGVAVGVIDTGIDDGHPDLRGQVVGRRDYVNDGEPAALWHPHGTHVAGIIAADGELQGVAPGCKLRDYRVLDKNGYGEWPAICQAVRDAVTDGCQIINMSLGGPEDDPGLHDAIRAAVAAGVTVVVAVGNDGAQRISYPGYYPEVIGAGAVMIRPDGLVMRSWFSNTNPEVDVCAPGQDVISCAAGGGYLAMSGTSMASPHVAGKAALEEQRGRARLGRPMSEPGRWEAIKVNTIDVMMPGVDTSTGAGFVSALPVFPVRRRIELQKGNREMLVDGGAVMLDVPAQIINGRFVAPFRAMAENVGGTVGFDEKTMVGSADFWLLPGMEV